MVDKNSNNSVNKLEIIDTLIGYPTRELRVFLSAPNFIKLSHIFGQNL